MQLISLFNCAMWVVLAVTLVSSLPVSVYTEAMISAFIFSISSRTKHSMSAVLEVSLFSTWEKVTCLGLVGGGAVGGSSVYAGGVE